MTESVDELKYKAGDVVWYKDQKWRIIHKSDWVFDSNILFNGLRETMPIHDVFLKPVVRCYAVLS